MLSYTPCRIATSSPRKTTAMRENSYSTAIRPTRAALRMKRPAYSGARGRKPHPRDYFFIIALPKDR